MKKIWLHIVQAYIHAGFTFYYKKIDACYQAPIPRDKPVLFLSNHQNALLDPLLITVKSKRKNYFLTRASVFKNPMIARFLHTLQMLPVYRVRDGMHNITKNHEIFARCAEVLTHNQSIILFPEGSHSLNRSVRNLSKGFTRIIDETLARFPQTHIYIIPVGLNFQNPTQWADSVSVYYGSPIDTRDFISDNGKIEITKLKETVKQHIKQLTTHIEPNEEYTHTAKQLDTLQVDYTRPETVNQCIANGFVYQHKTIEKPSLVFLMLRTVLKILFWLPYGVWQWYVKPKIKEDEFIGTFRYAVLLTLAPIFLIAQSFIVGYLVSVEVGILFFTSAILLSWITVKIR